MGLTFRIAACNVQTGIGTTKGYWQYLTTGWKYYFPHGSAPIIRAASFLAADAIDVAAFCEVEGGSRRSQGVDQVQLISEHTPLKHRIFFPTLVVGERVNQGNAMASRFPIRRVKNHPLPGPGEPRFLSEAALDLNGTPARLFTTHLSLQRKIRSPQIHHIAHILRQENTPTILAGDFNISHEAELDLLAESQLTKTISIPTFPSWRPGKALDHLFFSAHFTLLRSYAFDLFRFSDHLPVVAEVELRDRAEA